MKSKKTYDFEEDEITSDDDEEVNQDLLDELDWLTRQGSQDHILNDPMENIKINPKKIINDCDIENEVASYDETLQEELKNILKELQHTSLVKPQNISDEVDNTSKITFNANTDTNENSAFEKLETPDILIDAPRTPLTEVARLKRMALAAKKAGDIDLAKKYLREAKLISTLPNSNQLSESSVEPINIPTVKNSSLSVLKSSFDTEFIDFEDIFEKSIYHFTQLGMKAQESGDSAQFRRYQRTIKMFKTAHEKYKRKIPYSYEELVVAPNLPKFPPGLFSSNTMDSSAITTDGSQLSTSTMISANTSPLKSISQSDIYIDPIRELKLKALEAKKAGNIEEARKYFMMAKEKEAKNSSLVQTHLETIDRHNETTFEPIVNNSKETDSVSLCLIGDIEMAYKNILQHIPHTESTSSRPDNFFSQYKELIKAIRDEMAQTIIQFKISKQPLKAFFQKRYLPKLIQNISVPPNFIQLNISQLISFTLPKTVKNASYLSIIITFPFPKEKNQTVQSQSFVFADNTLDINFTFRFNVDREDKSLIRQLKRATINFQIVIPGGLFRKSEVVGLATLKLDRLLSESTIHENIPIFHPKKSKSSSSSFLRVSLLQQNPFCGVQIETEEINFLFANQKTNNLIINELQYINVSKISCLEILSYEHKELERKIKILENSGNPCDIKIAKIVLLALELKKDSITILLKKVGNLSLNEYLDSLVKSASFETETIKYYEKIGLKEMVDLHSRRYEAITKEISCWKKNKNP